MPMTAEQIRLAEDREKKAPWKKWGPYLSERQRGTVCEDYSEGGDAWNYFPHDFSPSWSSSITAPKRTLSNQKPRNKLVVRRTQAGVATSVCCFARDQSRVFTL